VEVWKYGNEITPIRRHLPEGRIRHLEAHRKGRRAGEIAVDLTGRVSSLAEGQTTSEAPIRPRQPKATSTSIIRAVIDGERIIVGAAAVLGAHFHPLGP
jgi:hypothetical protein